jgi:hypothetical protein
VTIPLAAVSEGWTAVLAGLIPIIGLVAIGWLIVRAVRDNDEEDD